MLDIGIAEFLLVAVASLLVLGPKRLPNVLRTLGLWQRRISSSYQTFRWELERDMPDTPHPDILKPPIQEQEPEPEPDAKERASKEYS
ncbi:MAG: Sec-independent protein translocase subunit TatA/TatB [Gammaproteobacteria bacterium]